MIELVIERWRDFTGKTDYLWSLWQGEERLGLQGPFDSPDTAEKNGCAYVQDKMGRIPDQITRL